MPNVSVIWPLCANYFVAVLLLLGMHGAQAAPQHLSEQEARHLLLRSGFAPTQAQVDAVQGQGAAQAVDALIAQALLAKPSASPAFISPAPAFTTAPAPLYRAAQASRQEQQAFRQEQNRLTQEIKNWWMLQMLQTPAPLAERMALLWHGHFATSQQKVVRAQAMWNQHLIFRQHALGNFQTMLHAIAKDPAMLVYLDGANSRKDAPNENFAREVMELFVLGEATVPGMGGVSAQTGLGGYTEADIREAARAFTGWSIEPGDFSYMYRPRFHDSGSKTLLGNTGNFDGGAALDLMLARPQAARFVATKLWREFISPNPEPVALERIAQVLRTSNWSIAAALREVFLSDAFWDAGNRGALIKSPVELLVGTARQFDLKVPQPQLLVQRSAQLGQNLLMPPNVKGWPGYTQWINSTTLLERKRFLEVALRDAVAGKSPEAMAAAPNTPSSSIFAAPTPMQLPAAPIQPLRFDASAWLAGYGARIDSEPGFTEKERIVSAILSYTATQNIANGTVGLSLIRVLVQDSAYQLK